MMNRLSAYLSASFAAVMLVLAGCSTMSRTEKQLARVDSFEAPDIPAMGQISPLHVLICRDWYLL